MADPIIQNQVIPSSPVQAQTPSQTSSAHATSAQATKQGSKISIKTFLVGCGIILLLVVGGLSLIFYRLISNPNQLTSLGIDPSTTKTLLQIFSTVFFGLLTFLGIGLLVVNLYRLIMAKNVSKLKFAFGAVG
jgi:hypothetical protein